MNFNLYLDRDAADRLARVSKRRKTPRNALIRQAVDEWLDREGSQWSQELLEYAGDPNIVAFESYRKELAKAVDDPFSSVPSRCSRARKSTLPRAKRK